MKERPIVMRDWEVRAVLESRKTQLRRIVKPQPLNHSWRALPGYKIHAHVDLADGKTGLRFHHSVERQDAKDSLHQDENWIVCPLGKPGERLWVKETFRPSYETDTGARLILFKAGGFPEHIPYNRGWDLFDGTDRWHPPVTMPRWASRITLEITNVRVERLRDIATEDAFAEGIHRLENHSWDAGPAKPLGTYQGLDEWSSKEGGFWTDAVSAYAALWESINGPGSWNANPWVWVIEFKQVEGGAS